MESEPLLFREEPAIKIKEELLQDGLQIVTVDDGLWGEPVVGVGRTSAEAISEVAAQLENALNGEPYHPRACIYNPRDY